MEHLILIPAAVLAVWAWKVWTDAVANGRTWGGMAKMAGIGLALLALLLWGRVA